MRLATILGLLATLSCALDSGAVRAAGMSTQPSLRATSTIPYTVVEQWNIGGAGGYARVVVVDPSQRSKDRLLALADQLRREAGADRNALVYIYDDPLAAKLRKDAGNEKLFDAEHKLHDEHMIGIYAKMANTGYHAMTLTLEGANGASKEVALH